jgi:hypothetical protein
MTVTSIISKHFPLGRVLITANADADLYPADVRAALQKHAGGDWGEVEPADAAENGLSLGEGFRLLSVY